jgi:hypothetical protein
VHVVRAAERETPSQRLRHRAALDDRGRDGEPDERQPEDRGEREPRKQKRSREEGERAGDGGHEPRAASRVRVGCEPGRVGIREREQRRGPDEDGDHRPATPPEGGLVQHRDEEPELERAQEVPTVQADRLGNELSDRARLGGKRWR